MDFQSRQALVAYLATKYGSSGSLGKKAVQKYVHILSSLSKRSVGYEFSFYTYGPFSRELASDLDILAASRAISVSYSNENNAYSIAPTPSSGALVATLPHDMRAAADAIWSKFEGRTAKQLELVSTILFVADEEEIELTGPDMTERVKALKPKYSISEIRTAQAELSSIST